MPDTPKHDNLFKYTFGKPEHAVGELRSVLPATIVDRIDWSTLELVSGSWVEPELRSLHSDLLYNVSLAGRPAHLYLLFEHQSRSDPMMAFRMHRYVTGIWSDWLRDNPEARSLPAVVPVVLYHGASGWTAAMDVLELIDLDSDTRDALSTYLPRLSYFLDDLSTLDSQTLRRRVELSALAKLTQALFQFLGPDPVALLRDWQDLLERIESSATGTADILAIAYYIDKRVGASDMEEVLRYMQANLGETGGKVVETLGDRLRAEGREEGREEGLERGRLETQQANILTALETRKLSISDAARSKILTCLDMAVLDRWYRQALVATSVDEVFSQD